MDDYEDQIVAENERLRAALKEAMILVNLAVAHQSSRAKNSKLAVIDVLLNGMTIDEVRLKYGYRWQTVQQWVKRTEDNLRNLAERAKLMRTRSTTRSTCSSRPAQAHLNAESE